MKVAYVDSSFLIAARLEMSTRAALNQRLAELDEVFSSDLIEAEYLSVLEREKKEDEGWLERVTLVHPDRSLRPEISRVLAAGYLRGAVLWHLANALYLAEVPTEFPFLTLDVRQREVAGVLGFPTP